jgi:hypothetical protein
MTILTAVNSLADFANDPDTRRAHGHPLSKFEVNGWNTNQLTLNIMQRVARLTKLNIHDDLVANELYWICNGLEDWPEDEGFGSSDSYGEYLEAIRVFHIPQEKQA